MTEKFTDMAVFQPDTVSYMKSLRNYGSRFNFVKLTENGWNDPYLNPKSFAQIRNSLKVWGKVGVYHFWHGESASYFLYRFKQTGLNPKSTRFALDVEDSYLPGNVTSGVNRFEHQLILYGFNKSNIWTYFPYSWISEKKITPSKFKYGFAWTAEYPYSSVYLDNKLRSTSNLNPGYNAWQFSGTGSQDWSFDYTGTLIDSPKPEAKKESQKSNYIQHGSKFKALSSINGYSDIHFKKAHGNLFAKGSVFYGKPVKDGPYYRIKTNIGYFTANRKFVEVINS